MKKSKEVVLILHNIRSVYNVGAIFRTADAAGITTIYLTGYTPTPLDRFGRIRKDMAKAALGAEKMVAWVHERNPSTIIDSLKKKNYHIIALEQSKHSTDYKKVALKSPAAIIIGNEVTGIYPALLKKCDIVAEIPMRGKKESLNVSVAVGVALFRILDI